MNELLEIVQLERIPKHVEAVKWDGTVEGAIPIIVWIESNGEHATLLREGDVSVYQPYGVTEPVRLRENYIAISLSRNDVYLNASAQHCWIVRDQDSGSERDEGDFIALEPQNVNDRYRRI